MDSDLLHQLQSRNLRPQSTGTGMGDPAAVSALLKVPGTVIDWADSKFSQMNDHRDMQIVLAGMLAVVLSVMLFTDTE